MMTQMRTILRQSEPPSSADGLFRLQSLGVAPEGALPVMSSKMLRVDVRFIFGSLPTDVRFLTPYN